MKVVTYLAVWVSVLSGCATIQPKVDPLGRGGPAFLEQYAETYRFRLGRPHGFKFTPDGKSLLFLRSGPRSKVSNLYVLDIDSGRETVLLTAQALLKGKAEVLSDQEKALRERLRQATRGISNFKLSKDGTQILVSLSGKLYVVNRSSHAVTLLKLGPGAPFSHRFSPDGKWVSYVLAADLYAYELATQKETQITHCRGAAVTCGVAEFVAMEEMGRYSGHWWSPDSQHLVFQKTDESAVETFRILDPVHPEKAVLKRRYPRPGKANAKVQLGIVGVSGGAVTWIQWDRKAYPYVATVRWQKDSPLTLVVQNRRQTEHLILTVDPKSGESKTIHTERDRAWINLDQSVPRWVNKGSEFLWSTEREGAWQLELRSADGALINALTVPSMGYRRLLSVDEKRGRAYISASLKPTEAHVAEVHLSTAKQGPRWLTKAAGNHSATFSRDHEKYVHTAYLDDGSIKHSIRNRHTEKLVSIKSVAEKMPFMPNLEFLFAGEKKRFSSLIIRPWNFESGRKYPVIVYVYGGPHYRVVSRSPSRYLIQQWFADQGFIVVMIDGRGTPYAGRDWERVIKGNLVDHQLEDQVAALQDLGKKYAELDMDRVGVYGWSFGGYMTAMMTMRRGDIYKAGVSGAPVADWRDYDTHYTERYMDLPKLNEAGYKNASVLTWASKMTRPLLIIHGTVDDNVYFMHAVKMSNALFRAGKAHSLLPLAGATHGVKDKVGMRRLYERMAQFFTRHLKK
jgi:dipeptidyl-peptidase-4